MKNQVQSNTRHENELWKGLVTGIFSGLVASWVMNQFQSTLHKLIEGKEKGHGAQSMQDGSPSQGVGQAMKEQKQEESDDNATERLAKVVSKSVFDQRLTESEKEKAGTAIHYAFGISTGAVYGAAAEYMPSVTRGMGLPFGTFVWVTADEGVVPLLGLSKSPTEYPISTHAYALASHLVYGLTTEVTRRAVRRVL